MTPTLYVRALETARKIAGVRTNPEHWANAMVHAFRIWTGESTLLTWCGIEVDLTDKGRQTTDLISCLQCGQGSWRAFRGEGEQL